jgi:integrase
VALSSHQQGTPVASERQTVSQYLEHWLEHVAKTQVRAKTYASYDWITTKHLVPGLGRTALVKLSPPQVQTFLNEKLKSGRLPKPNQTESRRCETDRPSQQKPGLTPRTVQHIHATLRTALDQAERWGLIARNVAKLVDAPRVQRAEMQPLTPDEAKRLLDGLSDDRLHALYSVAMALGLRLGEALGLYWSDVDLDRRILTVHRALQRIDGKLQFVETKTQKSRRTLNLPQFAVNALLRHKGFQEQERHFAGERWVDSGLIFTTTVGTPLDGPTVTHRFQKALTKIGVRRIRFHDLRHSAASLLSRKAFILRSCRRSATGRTFRSC